MVLTRKNYCLTIWQWHACIWLLLEARDEGVIAVINLVLEPDLRARHIPRMDELELSNLLPNSILHAVIGIWGGGGKPYHIAYQTDLPSTSRGPVSWGLPILFWGLK